MTGLEDEKTGRHERVRFRRDEIVDLSVLPSSLGKQPPAARTRPSLGRRRSRALRWTVRIAVALVCFYLLVVGGLFALSYSGFGAQTLQAQAEAALRRAFGSQLKTSIGAARFSTSGLAGLSLKLTDVVLARPEAPTAMLAAQDLSFRLRVLPLLAGRVELADVELAGASIAADQFAGAGDGLSTILNERGLVDPDLALAAVFAGAEAVQRSVASAGAPEVLIENLAIRLGPGLPVSEIRIGQAMLRRTGQDLTLEGQIRFDERQTSFSAMVAGPASPRKFTIDMRSDKEAVGNKSLSLGDLAVSLTGDRPVQGQPARIEARIQGRGFDVNLGTRGRLAGSLETVASLTEGSGKVEIERLYADIGRSRFRMNGAAGPKPDQPVYRFELISNDSRLEPEDTGEAAMPMGMRLAGDYRPAERRLDVAQIGISGVSGAATGNALVQFADAGPPGIELALNVSDMAVAEVKQLWPWFAAESARRWVNANLFGGSVPEGLIRLKVRPGRFGDGQPLGNEEVFGHFKVAATRFDTTGRLPPIRDATGVVSFAGDDVDITLDRGTAFLPSGKPVLAERGRLAIDNARVSPIMGRLDMSLSGEASAIAELASLEPIDVMQRTGIAPETLSGNVQAKVAARIPMEKKHDKNLLTWDVEIDYRDLSISRPVDGRLVSNADGTLVLDKDKAVIRADAELNGIPAEIDLVEPLTDASKASRQRTAVLNLDRKALQRIAPGLSGVVNGSMRVEVDATSRDRQHVEADLTGVALTLPAIGWTKSKGIPARLSFDLGQEGNAAQLTGFKLSGDSFGASGSLSVANGALASARLDSFRLNRGDQASLRVSREGNSYSVSVNGASLDARPIINMFIPGSGKPTGSGGAPVVVKAQLDRLVGFNDEAMSDVTLSYSSGRAGKGFSFDGKSDRGRAVKAERRSGALVVETPDAGSLLRFLNLYNNVEGGAMALRLKDSEGGVLTGALDTRDFWIVNEPRLKSIVSAAPQGAGRAGDGRTAPLDTSRVRFDRGYAVIEAGPQFLRLRKGVVRGPAVGSTFQGTVYDENDRMDMTGTFMPAYGLNSIFGDVPIVGALLGNGNDKGLIGVTYKLTGNSKSPQLQINPLSVIAPGIFRSIFEFQ